MCGGADAATIGSQLRGALLWGCWVVRVHGVFQGWLRESVLGTDPSLKHRLQFKLSQHFIPHQWRWMCHKRSEFTEGSGCTFSNAMRPVHFAGLALRRGSAEPATCCCWQAGRRERKRGRRSSRAVRETRRELSWREHSPGLSGSGNHAVCNLAGWTNVSSVSTCPWYSATQTASKTR